MESGKIIVVANQKGGVAKTSTVRNLSYALAEMGKKVLVVDFDPQYNLTTSFGVLPTQAPYNTGTLITNLLLDESLPDTNEFIQKIGSVDLIPSSRSLTVAEANLLMTPDSNDYLAALLNPLRLSYDYIIITSSYLRSESMITAVEENIHYLNPPVADVFRGFLAETNMISADVKQALSNMKPKLDNYVFREWVDAAIACQDDKSLKSTLTPIIGKLSDMRIVAAELDYLLYEPFKEFITMAFLLIGNK